MRSRKVELSVAVMFAFVAAVIVLLAVGWWEAALGIVAVLQAAIVVLVVWSFTRMPRSRGIRRMITNAATELTQSQHANTAQVTSAVKAGASDARKSTDAMATSVSSMQSKIQNLDVRLSSVQSNQASLDSQLSNAAATLTSVDIRMASVLSLVESLETRLSSAESFLTTGDELRKELDNRLAWRMNRYVVSQVEGLLQLYLDDRGSRPMPLSGGWAIDPPDMSAALDAIARRRPQLVVELGGGTSTAWIALLLERVGEGRIVSIDHDQKFADVTSTALARLGLADRVSVRVTDLVPTAIADHEAPWYDMSQLHDLDRIDVLLIDGPPQRTGGMARYPAVPQLYDQLSDEAIILIDDAKRDDESAMIRRWLETYPALREEVAIPRSGLRVLRKTQG